MNQLQDLRLAVLIDADNVPYHSVREMMEEIARYGTPTYKRIYADWTKPTVKGWKEVLLEHAISPVQQYSYTKGKNSSDSALIIDAMDILYTRSVDGFCIVSSDSDFTRLATRLRESGMKVIGIGEKKTPQPFISACNQFIYIEVLKKPVVKAGQTSPSNTPAVPVTDSPIARVDEPTVQVIKVGIGECADEEGWVALGVLGNYLLKIRPDFDVRNFGYRKFSEFIRNIPGIQMEVRPSDLPNVSHHYVRLK